ncbi:DUF4367 domain-containing protein [Clostridium sp. D33t1_170424_F3]|uniref:DUF4367 domain-containing protein n=1 Tax=Clostridium sp. D33t1_170424_F3 TaxID=2787099 RepID=UPI0018AB8FEC|nr:DUF4367 domain-containing protein [Clostridium sp. D33t1_170424_F3]
MSYKDDLTEMQKNYLAALAVNQERLIELPTEEEIHATPIPPSLKIRMDQLLSDHENKQKTSQVRKHFTKIAACILLFTVLPLSIALSVKASREIIFQFFGGYFSITDQQESPLGLDANIPLRNFNELYLPQWMPENYMATEWSNLTDPMTIVYTGNSSRIRFFQSSTRLIQFDDSNIENFNMYKVNSQIYFYGNKEIADDYPNKLIWQKDGYYFSLEATEDQGVLFKIAESIKWKGN